MNATVISRHPWLLLALCALLLLGWGANRYRSLTLHLLAYPYWKLHTAPVFEQGYVNSGDARLYYRSYGEGPSLLLLHGGLSSMSIFFTILPTLTQTHRVILVDLRGQGHSSMGSQAYSYHVMTSDVLAVLDHLQVPDTGIIGWSDGGIIGLLMALTSPERVTVLISIGANYHPSGLLPEIREGLNQNDLADVAWFGRLLYCLESPEPQRWREVAQAIKQLWLTLPNLQLEDLATIATPALVVVGEHDDVSLEHTVLMAQALQQSSLVVIPDAGHNLLLEAPDQLMNSISAFLQTSAANSPLPR